MSAAVDEETISMSPECWNGFNIYTVLNLKSILYPCFKHNKANLRRTWAGGGGLSNWVWLNKPAMLIAKTELWCPWLLCVVSTWLHSLDSQQCPQLWRCQREEWCQRLYNTSTVTYRSNILLFLQHYGHTHRESSTSDITLRNTEKGTFHLGAKKRMTPKGSGLFCGITGTHGCSVHFINSIISSFVYLQASASFHFLHKGKSNLTFDWKQQSITVSICCLLLL